jgi:hypothetical protein
MEGIAGRTVALKQHDPKGPEEKRIWMWVTGMMYLGEWKIRFLNRYSVRHGFGAIYNRWKEYTGFVYIGEWKDGKAHGFGRQFWLESAPSWKENRIISSPFIENGSPRPFVYCGRYVNGCRQDESATFTLKDGTTRVGAWNCGYPVGDWWKGYQLIASVRAGTTTTTALPFAPPNRPSDGVRNGINGWWISEAEARERTVGNEEWWKMEGIAGKTVELKQYSRKGPKERPIWMWSGGNMYLGEWKRKVLKRYPLCHGFGAVYNHRPLGEGSVYIGEIKDAIRHGLGKQFWLESAPRWKENNELGSPIIENGIPRPFVYSGLYVNNFKHDASAAMTLKDGTTRVGPWKRGRPVGYQRERSTSQVKAEEPAALPNASTRVSPSSTVKQAPPREASMDERKPSAQLDSCSQITPSSDTAPQKISQIVFPNDSKDNDDNFHGNGAFATAAVPDGALSSQGQATISLKECRVEKITEWLTSVIGFDPVQAEMDVYARIFYDVGLHSVEMIVNLCTKADVEEFDWMKKFHRDRVAAALQA